MDNLIASSTCSVVSSTTTVCQYFSVATSSPAVVSNTITSGDILISFWLFLGLTIFIIITLVNSL